MSCYPYDASGFLGNSFGANQKNKIAWDTFTRIQSFNSNVSTLRAAGNTNLQYYNFQTYSEKINFQQGQFLHLKSLPAFSSLWLSVGNN